MMCTTDVDMQEMQRAGPPAKVRVVDERVGEEHAVCGEREEEHAVGGELEGEECAVVGYVKALMASGLFGHSSACRRVLKDWLVSFVGWVSWGRMGCCAFFLDLELVHVVWFSARCFFLVSFLGGCAIAIAGSLDHFFFHF
jgi:hypothetical protein